MKLIHLARFLLLTLSLGIAAAAQDEDDRDGELTRPHGRAVSKKRASANPSCWLDVGGVVSRFPPPV